MKISICNLGCKVNAYEAEAIGHQFVLQGYKRVEFDEPADVAMIFTCAVTNMAAQKSRKMMHRARRLNPNSIIVMVGCYVQVEENELQDADIIVGTKFKTKILDLVEAYQKNHEKIRLVSDLSDVTFDDYATNQFEHKTRAFLKIQDGCNQFCSYCIIPYARGKERSMPVEQVIENAKMLAKEYPEIVLAGIHTGRYGREYNITLAQLLKRILHEVKEVQRLRISSIEVSEIDDELIALMQNEPRLARHLHIPLQSGCDSVLKRMRRPYDTAYYLRKIEAIRKAIPGISISCDIIVGFPQESEEEFEKTYNFLKACQFSFLHVFPYSLRKGTDASRMPCQVDSDVKKERAKRCMALSQDLYDIYMKQWVNQTVDVIIESQEDGYGKGHASQYMPIYVKDHVEKGMVRVFVDGFEDHKLFGHIQKEEAL